MVDANEGILLRHRDVIVPFFIVFASAGMSRMGLFRKEKDKWKITS